MPARGRIHEQLEGLSKEHQESLQADMQACAMCACLHVVHKASYQICPCAHVKRRIRISSSAYVHRAVMWSTWTVCLERVWNLQAQVTLNSLVTVCSIVLQTLVVCASVCASHVFAIASVTAALLMLYVWHECESPQGV